MEDTLRGIPTKSYVNHLIVLILVLMEDTLRVARACLDSGLVHVLILVLMEDTLRDQDIQILYISGIGIYKPKQIGFC